MKRFLGSDEESAGREPGRSRGTVSTIVASKTKTAPRAPAVCMVGREYPVEHIRRRSSNDNRETHPTLVPFRDSGAGWRSSHRFSNRLLPL